MSKYTKVARNICDLLLFIALCVSVFMVKHVIQRNKRGFFCGDDSLAYPLRDNTIGVPLLLSCTLAIPAAVIIVVELFKQLGGNQRATDKTHNNMSNACSCGCRIGHRLLQCYKQIGYFLFGLGLTVFVTQMSKYTIGRLRPHFFEVCQPMLPDGSTCADAQNHGHYIELYTCSNPNATEHLIDQLTKSFPSGHSSIIFYAMSYLSIYLQAVLSTRLSKLLKHLLQFLFIMLAWYFALTRITDYWHHWSDVLAGAVLGIAFAALIAIYVSNLFAFKRNGRFNASVVGTNKSQVKPQVSPKNSGGSKSTSASIMAAAAAAQPALPAYTFGTLPYLPHPAQAHYAQTYHNYGYVP